MGKKTHKIKARIAAAAGMAIAASAANANFIDGPEGIGDLVWVDSDMNGIQDGGEVGLAGVTVNLLKGSDETLLGSTTTNASGNYVFYFDADVLETYSFKIEFELPSGYLFSPQNQGTDDTVDSDADPSTGLTSIISTCSQCIDLNVDAGMYLEAEIPLPAAVWLFGSGLLGLVGIARRKKA